MYLCVNMNKALICIGSNMDRETNLTVCKSFLKELFGELNYSDTSVTTPYGQSYKQDFLNQLALFYTDKKKEDVINLLKDIEKSMGRKQKDKLTGLVKIDVDLLCWNQEILKPEDMTRRYVTELLSTIRDDRTKQKRED